MKKYSCSSVEVNSVDSSSFLTTSPDFGAIGTSRLNGTITTLVKSENAERNPDATAQFAKTNAMFSNLVDYSTVPYGAMVSKGFGTTLILLAKSALQPNKKLY